MSHSKLLLSVYTDHNTPQPTRFAGHSLGDAGYSWYIHAVNSSHDPQLCLPQLLAFLQHPSFTFHRTTTRTPSQPAESLQLLSLVDYPHEGTLRWIQSATQMDPDFIPKVTPLLPPFHPHTFVLVFLTSDQNIHVWHWDQTDVQLRQDTRDPQGLPVIPAYLCETISFDEESTAAFLVGNDAEEITSIAPMRVPLTTLLRLFATQPNLLPALHSLPSSFELFIAYCPQYLSPQTRRGLLRIEATTPNSVPFHIQSGFSVTATDIDGRPAILLHLQNFLSSYFQWQALQGLCLYYGFSLVPTAYHWTVPGHNNPPSYLRYIQWLGSEPGGYARLPCSPTTLQRFGAYNDTGEALDIVPLPLDGLSDIWESLLIHLEHLQLAQLQC